MTEEELIASVDLLDDFRTLLPFHITLEREFKRALERSYKRRQVISDESIENELTVKNKPFMSHQTMQIIEQSNAVPGFTLLGLSGCGKTTGINTLVRRYPQTIIHDPGTFHQSTQIVYLIVECPNNNGFAQLYKNIGKAIDRALGNFNHAYAFEPCKSIRFLCEANILMHNKVDNVDVFDCGISNENTTSYFNGWQLNTLPERDIETTCPLKAKEVTKGNIQLRTLDSFNFTNVGLIKIDIEGHELEALQGMIGTLVRNDYPPILIEIWTEDVYVEIQGELGRKRHEELLKLIDDLGYDIDWWYGDWETYLCKHRSHNYTQQEDSQE